MHLSVNLVTWNGEKYIPYLFESLRKQSFRDWELKILDNGSTDNTAKKIEREIENFIVPVTFKKNDKNLGFAGGHNLLYKETKSDFVVLLNQDIYLQSACFSKLVEFFETNERAGAATPKLMKWNFSLVEKGRFEESLTDQVDSMGLKVARNREVKEITGFQNHNPSQEIFGVSGALPIYRMEAVKKVEYEDGTIFDGTYVSYKEDVDLAFRLSAAGWGSYAVMDAVAFHDRSVSGPEEKKMDKMLKNKKEQSKSVKYNSYKNHLMTLYKNEYSSNFILDVFSILWYEFRKFIYYLFFEPSVLGGITELFKNRNELIEKRKWINKTKILKPEEIRKWWS